MHEGANTGSCDSHTLRTLEYFKFVDIGYAYNGIWAAAISPITSSLATTIMTRTASEPMRSADTNVFEDSFIS